MREVRIHGDQRLADAVTRTGGPTLPTACSKIYLNADKIFLARPWERYPGYKTWAAIMHECVVSTLTLGYRWRYTS